MATYTTNLNLTKPASNDNVSITPLNSNFDTIDAAFGTRPPISSGTTDMIAGSSVLATGSIYLVYE